LVEWLSACQEGLWSYLFFILHPYSLANDGVMQELLTGKNLSCSAVVSEIVFVDALKI
jgi:hypothetical protein